MVLILMAVAVFAASYVRSGLVAGLVAPAYTARGARAQWWPVEGATHRTPTPLWQANAVVA